MHGSVSEVPDHVPQVSWPESVNSTHWSFGRALPNPRVLWCTTTTLATCVEAGSFSQLVPLTLNKVKTQYLALLGLLDELGGAKLSRMGLSVPQTEAVTACTSHASGSWLWLAAPTECSWSLSFGRPVNFSAPHFPNFLVRGPAGVPAQWLAPQTHCGPYNQVKSVRHAAALALAARRAGAHVQVLTPPVRPH